MASEEHIKLSTIIKDVHESLRVLSKQKGPVNAWDEHVQDTERLRQYADAMQKLAGIWEENSSNTKLSATSRVKWTMDYCMSYFFKDKILIEKREREKRLLESLELESSGCQFHDENELKRLRILDVGSCFNPFRDMDSFEVTAIDLCPANDTVFQADFLNIDVCFKERTISLDNGKIHRLPGNYFDCVVFSLLLEYIPSSEQRMLCCVKAYELLKFEGILVIITPDSHVGKNASIMKNWRYTLGTLGFNRIKFEKLPHIACMVFRKSIDPRLPQRWADVHREPYMTLSINIPQDSIG